MNPMLRIDLHMHGPIGFEDYWIRKQGYNGKNILEELTDVCTFSRNINICAITSESKHLEPKTIHDRFYQLTKASLDLPKGYHSELAGNNVLVVENTNLPPSTGNKVCFINGQTVLVNEDGKRFDHLVVGSNEVPQFKSLSDTISYCRDHGLIQIAEHPTLKLHYGIGIERLDKYLEKLDAVEGFNAQAGFFPLNRKNKKTQQIAEEHEKPWISVSDAHRVEDAGLSHIKTRDYPNFFQDLSGDDYILVALKEILSSQNFENVQNGMSLPNLFNWFSKFMYGITFKKEELRM